MALFTRSRDAPTIPASSSWVTGSWNSSPSPASSSRRLAVRPGTSRNTLSASASSVAAQAAGEQLDHPPQQAGFVVEHPPHGLVRHREHG